MQHILYKFEVKIHMHHHEIVYSNLTIIDTDRNANTYSNVNILESIVFEALSLI